MEVNGQLSKFLCIESKGCFGIKFDDLTIHSYYNTTKYKSAYMYTLLALKNKTRVSDIKSSYRHNDFELIFSHTTCICSLCTCTKGNVYRLVIALS